MEIGSRSGRCDSNSKRRSSKIRVWLSMPPSLYIIQKQISGDCHDDCSDIVKVGRVMMIVKIRA